MVQLVQDFGARKVIFGIIDMTTDNSNGLPHNLICHITSATAVWVVNLFNDKLEILVIRNVTIS